MSCTLCCTPSSPICLVHCLASNLRHALLKNLALDLALESALDIVLESVLRHVLCTFLRHGFVFCLALCVLQIISGRVKHIACTIVLAICLEPLSRALFVRLEHLPSICLMRTNALRICLAQLSCTIVTWFCVCVVCLCFLFVWRAHLGRLSRAQVLRACLVHCVLYLGLARLCTCLVHLIETIVVHTWLVHCLKHAIGSQWNLSLLDLKSGCRGMAIASALLHRGCRGAASLVQTRPLVPQTTATLEFQASTDLCLHLETLNPRLRRAIGHVRLTRLQSVGVEVSGCWEDCPRRVGTDCSDPEAPTCALRALGPPHMHALSCDSCAPMRTFIRDVCPLSCPISADVLTSVSRIFQT